MRFKPRPTGHKQALWLHKNGQLFFSGGWNNLRKAHCKVCGCEIEKGLGERWLKFAPNNDFFFQEVYFCPICSAFWDAVTFQYKTLEEYIFPKKDPEQRRLIFEYISQHWSEF